MRLNPSTQYRTDANLRARQRLWEISERQPPFELFPWVLDLAGVVATTHLLDVGCGNGGYLALAAGIGVDREPGMLRTARAVTSSPLVCADAQALPFADGSFDVVLAAHMLYHVPDRTTAASELARVLRRPGCMVAVTNSDTCHAELRELIESAVGNGWRMERPAATQFSMENGAAQLRTAFASVERVDAPVGIVHVTDADALADYVASVEDHYAPDVAGWTTWDRVVQRCRANVVAAVEAHGAFTITSVVGAFLCRNESVA